MSARPRTAEEMSPAMALVLLLAGVLGLAAALAAVLALAGAQFGEPAWLHAAWVAPLVVVLDAAARARRRTVRQQLGEPQAIARLVQGRGRGVRAWRTLLLAWTALLLAVASARPQWGAAEEEVRQHGVDVFMLLDTSASMLAEDVRPNRLARAKLALSSLVDRLEGDRIALIAFSGEARLSCPLTTDRAAVKSFLDLLGPDVLQQPGTAIGPALRLALRSVDPESGRSAAVVLISDGEDLEGGLDEPLAELEKAGIVVHALGVGRVDGAPVPLEEDGRTQGYLQDEAGKPVVSRLDVATLERIARETGGVQAVASSSEIELSAIAGAIASMEGSDLASRTTRIKPDRQQPFLAAAFLLLSACMLLPDGGLLLRRRGTTRVERLVAAAASRRTARGEGKAA